MSENQKMLTFELCCHFFLQGRLAFFFRNSIRMRATCSNRKEQCNDVVNSEFLIAASIATSTGMLHLDSTIVPVSGLFMETYIAQGTSWTMAFKQTLAALNWVKVFHLARERFLAIKDAWMVEAIWCDGLPARSSPELQVEKITKLHRGKYRFLVRMAAIFSLSTIHWLLYASWLGVSCIGFRHKLLGLCMYI